MNKERRKNKDTEKKIDWRVGNLRRDGFVFVVSLFEEGDSEGVEGCTEYLLRGKEGEYLSLFRVPLL